MNEGLVALVEGFMYPNEMELQWSVLIVLYPFITGLVAGAFILWGWSILKYGTKQGLRQRRERRKLTELSEKLDRVQGERPPDEA